MEGIHSVATSSDLKTWQRYENNPILKPGDEGSWDGCLIGDPYLIGPIDSKWYMFYYGYDGKKAYEGMAVSEDLYQWEKYRENPIILPGKEGEFDEAMVHKPCVLEHNGVWYHFYTARPRNWDRDNFIDGVITFATNVNL